jgi:hypothetical protein
MKSTESRLFHLGDILSITTGRLVSPRHIDSVYDILNFMTGDNLFTHALARASGECEGPLLEQHPQLRAVVADEGRMTEDGVQAWLAQQVARFGEHLPVSPLQADEHTVIDPLTELAMIRPDMPVIPVIVGDNS